MKTVNMHEAKTHLSRLVEGVLAGEPFVIAKAGRPVAKVIPLEAEQTAAPKRLGFYKGKMKLPDDFDTFMQDEIIEMFGAGG